jgi:hypothetical protein
MIGITGEAAAIVGVIRAPVSARHPLAGDLPNTAFAS